MEKRITFRSSILKSKLGYAGVLFFIFLLTRETIYCHFWSYACGEELESLVPYVIILIYFGIVGVIVIFSKIAFSKKSKNYIKIVTLTNYAIEMAFYATSIMLLRFESSYPYLILRICFYIVIDLVFMFLIFRKTFSSKQERPDDTVVSISFANYLVVTILSLSIYLAIISTVPWLYRIVFLGMH